MSYPEFKTETYDCTGGINTKASPYLTGNNQFLDLINVNFVQPGALTKRPGTAPFVGATVSGRVTSGIQFERLSGASYVIVAANTNLYTISAGTFSALVTGLQSGALFDFVPFVDRLFAANGSQFFKTDGANFTNYGLPAPSGYGITAAYSSSGGFTGVVQAAPGYFNDRGYFGPIGTVATLTTHGASANTLFYYGLTLPPGFGVSGVQFYHTSPGGGDLFGSTQFPGSAVVSGATLADSSVLTTLVEPTNIYFTLTPRYLELYNNQLFMAGFSTALSTAVWSDIGEPESVQPDYEAEFRTNDGDRITGMKAYSSALIVSKQRSFHRITGDDPNNFQLQEISDQYGCLSNRAMVVWEDRLWFLDPKGVVEYNGANIGIVSNDIEPLFTSMNVAAAIDNATALHVREKNEVWFAFPIDGATMNNCIAAYDYVAKAWTRYKGVDVSQMFLAQSPTIAITPFVCGYTGGVGYFGSSLFGDNSQSITCTILTRFQSDRGQTQESQYRQFYLSVDPIFGATQSIGVNLRSNFGTSIQASRTMYQAPFQSRIDFGIPARSIQAEIIHSSATLPFRVTGYAFASRLQRKT